MLRTLRTAVSCVGISYFWTQGGWDCNFERTPPTGYHAARHLAPAFLALGQADGTLVGNSAPQADGDQREESPAEQGSHLLLNSG